MKITTLVVGVLVTNVAIAVMLAMMPVEAGVVIWPGEEPRIFCDAGCYEGDSNKDIFYTDPDVSWVVLRGEFNAPQGDWYQNGNLIGSTVSDGKIMAATGNHQNITLISGGYSKTITLTRASKTFVVRDLILSTLRG